MATSIPIPCVNVRSTLPCFSSGSMLRQPRTDFPVKINKVSPSPEKTPAVKDFPMQGCLKEAFKSLDRVITPQTSLQVSPVEAFSQIIELCAAEEALAQGQQLHAHLIKSSFFGDPVFLNTKLVFMYGKCGSCSSAAKLFDRMSERTVFAWNAMMGIYLANEDPLASLVLYREMRLWSVPLDSCTFLTVLKACGMLRDCCSGAEIHGLAIKLGFASVLFVANSLIGMYAKCNDLDGARQLFDSSGAKAEISTWNSIISSYLACGRSLEALLLLRELQESGLSMSARTIVAALQACEYLDCRKLGMEIHASILKSGDKFNVYVVNALISMYARFDKMKEASNIFFNFIDRDSVSWNSMLSGFLQNGLYSDVLQFFCDMQKFDREVDSISVMSVLTASGRLGNLLHGRAAHGYIIRKGLDSSLQVRNTLMDMYAKCGSECHMARVFYEMPVKDKISWATVIAGYTQTGCHINAFNSFREAQLEGVDADEAMLRSILIACCGLKYVSLVKEVHTFMLKEGLNDLMLQNKIVDAYGACGNTDYALRAFALIENKDVVSWTSMISCYIRNGFCEEAVDIFLEMTEAGIEADSVTLVSLLSAAAHLSLLNKGKEIHGTIFRKGFILEGTIASCLVDMYARCGDLDNSYRVFSSISTKSLSLWTAMIHAYGMHGHGKVAIELFDRMIDDNLVPDHMAFLAVIYACSHSGLINEGKSYFKSMQYEYQLEPRSEHYACLVDLLGRGNCLDEAYEFIKSMPIQPAAEVWCSLLGACQVHSDKKLGEIAMHKLLESIPENPGNYVLISNVFAASGRWKDVKELRMKMKGVGLRKTPGCSWIEHRNKIHSFLARDKSHPQSDQIYQKLVEVTETLVQEGGYVAQTKFVLHNVEEEEKVQMLYGHSERLAIAYGLIETSGGTPIRVAKNLRICGDCHTFCKLVSKFYGRELLVRDASRFHHFNDGVCSCRDFW